jgi:hypothetical protein
MNDAERAAIRAIIRDQGQKNAKSKKSAMAALKRAGIVDSKGDLTTDYGGEGEPARSPGQIAA